MLNTPFMDEVHRWTYKPPLIPNTESHLRDIRTLLRQANRFIIDDDTIRLVAELSSNYRRFPLWSSLARIPYDTVWVEYDMEVRWRAFLDQGLRPDQIAPFTGPFPMGCLLTKDLPSTTRWVAREFTYTEGGGAIIEAPITLTFDPEASTDFPTPGSTLYKQRTLTALGYPHINLKAKPNDAKFAAELQKAKDLHGVEYIKARIEHLFVGVFDEGLDKIDPEGFMIAPQWVDNKAGVVFSPMWLQYLFNYNNTHSKEEALKMQGSESMDMIVVDAKKRMGILRYYVCLLAVINEAPTQTRFVKPRQGTMQIRSHNLKYMAHHTITINVPKRVNLVRYVDRLMTSAARRKRHRVRGHWRCVEYGNRRPIPCQHLNTEIDDGMGICPDCERIVRWIEFHDRGDASLGWVNHDYVVKTRNHRPPKESSVNRVESPPGHG